MGYQTSSIRVSVFTEQQCFLPTAHFTNSPDSLMRFSIPGMVLILSTIHSPSYYVFDTSGPYSPVRRRSSDPYRTRRRSHDLLFGHEIHSCLRPSDHSGLRYPHDTLDPSLGTLLVPYILGHRPEVEDSLFSPRPLTVTLGLTRDLGLILG